jgi:hypothetical protein
MASSSQPPLERTAEARERARAKLMARTPAWYNPWAHLASTTGIGLMTLTLATYNLHGVRLVELLTIPAVFLLANAFEWRAHRDVLHRRFWPFEEIYVRHTPEHHAVYMTNDMAMRSSKEFRLVLIPALGILGIVLLATPVAYGVSVLLGKNCGWLFLATASMYMVLYELSHLAYHLPETTFIGRRKVIGVLREHHARHHDPRLMQRHNFNVTIPIFDWLCGTMAPKRAASRGARLKAEAKSDFAKSRTPI